MRGFGVRVDRANPPALLRFAEKSFPLVKGELKSLTLEFTGFLVPLNKGEPPGKHSAPGSGDLPGCTRAHPQTPGTQHAPL